MKGQDYDHLLDLIYTEEELVLPGEDRLKIKKGGRAWRKREREKKAKIDRRIEIAHNRKQTQRKYYEANKEKLNHQRALLNRAPHNVYYKAKKRAEVNDIPWEFTLETWAELWMQAPKVVNPTNGFLVSAWSMKGANASKCAQMIRLDTTEGWSPENCAIAYKGEVIEYGTARDRGTTTESGSEIGEPRESEAGGSGEGEGEHEGGAGGDDLDFIRV